MKQKLLIITRIISYILFFILCLFVIARSGYGMGEYPISALDWGNGCARIIFVLPWIVNILILVTICLVLFKVIRRKISTSWAALVFVPVICLPVYAWIHLGDSSICGYAFSYKPPPFSLFDKDFKKYKKYVAEDIFERAKLNRLTANELKDYSCVIYEVEEFPLSNHIELKQGNNLDYEDRARIGNVIGELDLPEGWGKFIPKDLKDKWCTPSYEAEAVSQQP